MADERSAVDGWQGGRLRVYAPMAGQLFPVTDDETGEPLEHDYEPAGDGWAILADAPPVELNLGVELDFELRNGRLECVGVRSHVDGPPLGASLLRQVGPLISPVARGYWESYVVRLREHKGQVVAVIPWAQESGIEFGTIAAEVTDEYDARRRQPITDERLAKVAELWLEAEQAREPSAARYVAEALNYAPGTVRNLMKVARDRADEYAAAKHELLPAQVRLKNAARRVQPHDEGTEET